MMESTIFPQPAVAGELQRFVEARLHTDHAGNPELNGKHKALQEQLIKSRSLPSYAILDPTSGRPVGPIFEGAKGGAEAFIAFLREVDGLPAAR